MSGAHYNCLMEKSYKKKSGLELLLKKKKKKKL